jgi:hypothetical protein
MAKILDAVDTSADRTSKVVNIAHSSDGSVQIILTNADSVASIYLQGSNDNTNWTNLSFKDAAGSTLSSIPVSSGTDINDVITTAGIGMQYIRVFYDRTSGGASDELTVIEFHKATTR